MDQQPCITDNIWLGYSNKTLSQTEIDTIHHHAETCEICSDIKDGIDAMAQPQNLEKAINTINQKIDSKIEPKQKLGIFWYWSAAAVLIFGIGLSWFWVNETQPVVKINTDSLPMAKETEPKSELQIEPTPIQPEQKEIPLAVNEAPQSIKIPVIENKDREDDAKILEEDLDATSMDDKEAVVETKKLKDTALIVITPPIDTTARGNTWTFSNVTTSDAATYNYTSPASTESFSLDNTVILSKSENYKFVEADESKSSARKKVSISSKKSSAMPAPMSNSNTNNATNTYAISKYIGITDSANFALAFNYFSQNNFAKCIESLKNITANASSLYYEEGLILQAKALIKQNKIKEAKIALRTVSNLKGKRKNEADEILKDLK